MSQNTEVLAMMRQLKKVFDIVRLVDVSAATEVDMDENGNLTTRPYRCYAVWRKGQRCEHCVSARAIACMDTRSKFEFVDNAIYYVISKYMKLDGVPYTLEMVSKVDDETLVDAYGENEFIQTISQRNDRMYIDSLTKVYNRRYYDDQLQHLLCKGALAIVDLDNFKTINDTYGHMAGDRVLQEVAGVLRKNVRDTDAVVRYGGDEFVVVLKDFPGERFQQKLENMRAGVAALSLEALSGRQITVSIGGVCWQGEVRDALSPADKMLYQAKAQKNMVVIAEA